VCCGTAYGSKVDPTQSALSIVIGIALIMPILATNRLISR
jgi:hypothetical protein